MNLWNEPNNTSKNRWYYCNIENSESYDFVLSASIISNEGIWNFLKLFDTLVHVSHLESIYALLHTYGQFRLRPELGVT